MHSTMSRFSRQQANLDKTALFTDLTDRFSKILRLPASSKEQLEGIRRTIAKPTRSQYLDTFARVLDSDRALDALASKSKFNKNGFYKIRIAETPDFAVRLHIWLPGIYANEHLHSHRWPLVSRVMKGQLSAEYWEDSLNSHGVTLDEYHYADGNTPLRFIGGTTVQKGRDATYTTDDSYLMTSDELHRVAADPLKGCSTLAVRFGNTRAWARNLMTEEDSLDVSPGTCDRRAMEKALSWLVRDV